MMCWNNRWAAGEGRRRPSWPRVATISPTCEPLQLILAVALKGRVQGGGGRCEAKGLWG